MIESTETKNTHIAVEELILAGKDQIETISLAIESGFFDEGCVYDLVEEVVGEKRWQEISNEDKAEYLKVGSILGVELLNIRDDQILRREFISGTQGTRGEQGADVTVLKTENHPLLEVHVCQPKDADLEVQYYLKRI